MEGAKFDAYETIGIIAPGVVIALLLVTESSQIRELLGDKGFSLGGLGLFLMVSFVLGHLVQSLGNLAELVVWPIAGLPTNRLRFPGQTVVTSRQRQVLINKITDMEGTSADFGTYTRLAWRAVTARMYSRVRHAGQSAPVDNANRTYGLFRGLTASFVVSLGWYALRHRDQGELIVLLAAMLVAAAWRMRRAGIHYARALVLEFIDLPEG